ncbi:kinase-like domain-containing protein [Lasiosphaeria hispida]|uniref:Kinase-like domain-containing protein n=1 Tax=Lasiosphaeria hispida TaxID=260671 RepID=A0AAJ0HDT3_9PEZI|nr:kinase-like domain-containing protein [Lasiosphaeria hispida]
MEIPTSDNEWDWDDLFNLFNAVEYLHRLAIVHGDIRPENIQVHEDFLHVKLTDFDVSRLELPRATSRTVAKGYAALELLSSNEGASITQKTEIWALGVLLYICLCGFPPFSGDLKTEEFPYGMDEQIRQGRFNYPSPHWDSISGPALDLIDSMLVVNPEQRFAIGQCLSYPWVLTGRLLNQDDEAGGVLSGIAGIDL